MGNSFHQLKLARDRLKSDCATGFSWAQSFIYNTTPVSCPEGSPDYLNAVLVFSCDRSSEQMLTYCKDLEREMGRAVDGSSGEINLPRVIDLDLLYCGDEIVNLPHLVVPHPRMGQRRFVLEPLASIRPDHILPNGEQSIKEQLRFLESDEPDLKIFKKDW